MSADEILFETEEKMEKAVEFLKQELRSVRTGRATTGLVDHLKIAIESYGSTMSLRELANIGVADGNVIVIKPFDPSTLKDIQRGIEKSDIGINPMTDGKLIRLPVPPLSTERRAQLVNQIKQLAEAQKVNIRNARRDANKAIEAAKKDTKLTEDEAEAAEGSTQKLTDDYSRKIDALLADKSKELMDT